MGAIRSRLNIFVRVLASIGVLFILLLLVFSIPGVQTYFGSYATQRINEKLDTNIKVGKVGLQLNGDIEFKNILIKDHKNDSLISINEFNSSILSFANINNNSLIFDDIDIYGLYFHIKTYAGEQASNLDVFIKKFKKDTESQIPFKLSTNALSIEDSKFKLSNENKLISSILDFQKLKIKARNFLILGPDVSTEIKALSFTDARGVQLQDLQTQFKYTTESMTFRNLKINTLQSVVNADLEFLYKRKDLKFFTEKVQIEANFKDTRINLGELDVFYPEFGATQNISFDAELNGTLNALEVYNLNLESDGKSRIVGDFIFKNLKSSELQPFYMNAKLKELSSNYKDLKEILPRILGQKLPSTLSSLGIFSTKGIISMSDQKITIDCDIRTELGEIYADLNLNDIKEIDAASYNGKLQLSEFDLGTFIQNRDVGRVNTNLIIEGEGFKIDNIRSNIAGTFDGFEYNNYNYQDLEVLGLVENKIFSGQLKANDNHLVLDFEGLVDFSEKENIYDFSASVKKADLNALNFVKRDSLSVFSGRIDMDMKGTNLDDLYGLLQFKDTRYTNQNDSYFFKDFQVVSTFDSDLNHTISVNSPEIIKGTFEGFFKIKQIPLMFENALAGIYSQVAASKISADQSLKFNFKVYNKIIEVFYPDLEFGANTFFRGVLDSDPSKFKLTFKSPDIRMESYFAKKVEIKFDNSNPLFNSYVELDSLSTPYIKANEFSLINVSFNDTLYIKSQFKGGKRREDQFDLNLYYTTNDKNYVLGLKPSRAKFKNTSWELSSEESAETKLVFNPVSRAFEMDAVAMTFKDQKISLRANAKDSLSTNIALEFRNVDLAKVTPEIDSLSLGGTINGGLNISKFKDTYLPKSMLDIEDFSVNGFNLGAFETKIEGNSSLTNYDVQLKIQDDLKESFSAVGNLDVSGVHSNLDLNLNFKDFILNPLNPFGGGVITNIRGKVSGFSKISGRLEKPQINGELRLDSGGISIPYLNIDYAFDDKTRVKLEGQSFVFEAAKFKDTKFLSKGILNGKMNHVNLKNWSLDTTIDSDRLLVLNTSETEESLYYGTGFVSGNIDISGPVNQLFVEANVITSKGTIFKIPLNDSEMITENSYVKFLSPEEKNQNAVDRAIKLDDIKGVEMEFNMDITDDAEIEIMIDKETESSIVGRGNGSILAQINTNDKFKMFGDFLVLSGYYNYSLGKLIKKKFKLVKDGSLLWEGNPLQAEINIEAIYDGINVNPSTLLDNPINQTIPVEVQVKLTGPLEKPDLDFDIRFPKINSTLNNELKDRLRDKDKREFQALSLLATGSFRSKISLDSQDAFELMSDGVTNVLNDIFSNEDNKVKLGLDLDLGKNTPEYETDSRVGVTLSTKISENVLINGKVGVPVGGVSQSTVAGDFEVEVLLNEDRTLSLKFFNRENSIQNFGEQIGYTQGLGLSYNIEFDNLKELFKKLFSNKEISNSEGSQKKEENSQYPDYINFK